MKALWSLYFLSQVIFFSPFADRTPIISQTNTKKHPSKPQNKSLETWYNNWSWVSIVGLSQESVMAWGDRWTEEAFGCGLWPSVSVGGHWGRDMKKKLWKVRGHLQQLSSLSITHFTWGLSGWWDYHWLMVESLFESLSSFALQNFTSGLCFFSWLPSNCHADFDLPTNYLLFFWVVKQDRSGKM